MFWVGIIIGALAGFALCLLLTAPKIGALQDQIVGTNYVRKAYLAGKRSTTITKED